MDFKKYLLKEALDNLSLGDLPITVTDPLKTFRIRIENTDDGVVIDVKSNLLEIEKSSKNELRAKLRPF
jgi:hypothetical protein